MSTKHGGDERIQPTNRLDLKNLERLELEYELRGEEPELTLEFPCNDSSSRVKDFTDWSFFKRPCFHDKPINMKASCLWNPTLLERLANQRHYVQEVVIEKKMGYRETQENLARKKRAKRALAIWKKTATRSVAAATNAGSEVEGSEDGEDGSPPGSPVGGTRSGSPGKKKGLKKNKSKTVLKKGGSKNAPPPKPVKRDPSPLARK